MMKPTTTRPESTEPPALQQLAPPLREPTTSTDWIGDGLRQLYRQVVDEPLPDSLASLLERLDESQVSPPASPERK